VSTDRPPVGNGAQSIPATGLGTHSARGLLYLMASSTAMKVITFVTQIVLLYLLSPTDFGVVALAYTITEFILIVGQAGVGDVLVSRRAFRQWVIPGFWLSLTLGIASGLLIVLSAPIASMIYGDDAEVRRQLYWVLMVLAPSPVFASLSVVPRAKLSKELRFSALACMNLGENVLLNGFTILFAYLGFGPFSFVLPVSVTAAVLAAALWLLVRPPWALQLRLRRWRYIIGDSTHLISGEFSRKLIDQSDYIALGLFSTPGIVGIYYNGMRFSVQMMRLLMVNMTNILFPAFTKLNDQPQLQYQGFYNAQRILAMIGVSGCLLQAAIAEPFARLVFPARWEDSIIVMQILSLGMSTRMVAGASYALMKSHGRFRTVSRVFWSFALIQILLLLVTLSVGGGLVGAAVVVSIVASFIGPVMFYMAIRPYGHGWSDVAAVLTRPLLSGIFSVGIAWLIGEWLKDQGYGDLVRFVEIVVVAVALNVLCAWLWMRPVWDDFWVRVRRLLPKRAVA
jgi:O-antigen/teichoic acid export membrane protein